MAKLSANLVNHAFWLTEFGLTIDLALANSDLNQVRQDIIAENIYSAATKVRLKQQAGVVTRRVNALAPAWWELFDQLDPSNQCLVNLIAIMATEPLIYTFMLDVFRQELILGDRRIEPYEMVAFFNRLSLNHEEVAQWRDQTVKKLQSTIRNYLRSARLVADDHEALVLQGYILDQRLVNLLQDDNKQDYLAWIIHLGIWDMKSHLAGLKATFGALRILTERRSW
ncbi:DUF1819 family protein [Lacticaseibacillus rhamnosus]|uniref:DUF1819 family protein n=1 Tax=Lacticaseibacillus rhamnosus TaxID=47715 RepID=UPI003DAA232D